MLSSRSASPSDKHQQQAAGGPLRRLLPAASAAGEANGSADEPGSRVVAPPPSSSGPPGNTPPVPARRKRGQATTAACGACRKRKSKCDGKRPSCTICRDRGTVCEFDTNAAETHTQALKRKYSELQRQKSAYEHIYEVLQSRPEREALEVYRRIRRGADASSILRHVNYGDVLLQLALVPEARYRYEFPYLPDMPRFLCRPDNLYLDSEVYEYALPPVRPNPPQPARPPLPDARPAAASVCDSAPRDPYLKPYSSATVVHPWLDSVRPSKWTAVSSDDVLMRRILHDYFLSEYDWFTFFHKDYFLKDMATENPRFCSSLLVNALLSLGCFCHRGLQGRAEFWNPVNIGYRFLAEAKRLFELDAELERPLAFPGDPDWERKDREWEQRRLATIHAALVLNMVHDLNGSDKIGWRFTLRALEMAHEIGLFEAPLEHRDAETQHAMAYTAWALFVWQSFNSYHYVKPPLLKAPPKVPLPDPLEQPQWYGELWVRYPLSQSRSPTYHGLLFKAKADFWKIMNDYSLLTLSQHRYPTKLSVHQIFAFYDRLRAWLDALPEPLTARRIVLPHQLKLHMHYNHILIDLFTPVLSYTGSDGVQFAETPHDICSRAAAHLETLVRLYYLRHGFDAFDCFLLHFLGFLNHMTMRAIEASTDAETLESHRSTLMLLMKGIHGQSRCHFVGKAILRLQASLMRPEDVELLKRFVEIEENQVIYGPLEHVIHTDWPAYEAGFEVRAEQRKQGRTLATALASLSLESSSSPSSARSPS